MITLIVGLVLVIVVFAIACWRMLQVSLWQKAGAVVQAAATLWALAYTARVIRSPSYWHFYCHSIHSLDPG